MRFRPVCPLDDIPADGGHLVVVDGKEIALFRVGERLHAMEDTCLHAGGPLHQGAREGTTITCPWHDWKFDLRDGSCSLNPLIKLACYPVRVVEGVVELAIEPPAPGS